MEVLQCDGCDFRAQSYEDLKAHIQDVHTAFLQPTDVADEGSSQARSVGTDSTIQSEAVFSPLKDEFVPTEETQGQTTSQPTAGSYYSHSPGLYSLSPASSSKPTNKFFQCKFCVRYFRSKYLLVEHTKKVHGSGGGSPGASGNLNYNVMLHEGFGKVFSCQFCTYKSPRRARIVKHQKMYHKNNIKEVSTPPASQTTTASMPVQESCKELPAEVVERSILESMVKPLTKSRGNFCCEWCSYQTPRRERWCDHMMKKHRGMVKILSSFRQDGLNMSDLQNRSSQMANPGTSYMPLNMATHDTGSVSMPPYRGPMNSLPGSNPSKYQPMPYVPIKPKISSNSSLLNLPERSPYGISEKQSTIIDMDESSYLNDSSSDDDYIDIDGENGLEQGMSGESLLGSDNNKLLETKGIPFRRFMNRFQCPFCPFLTMHRRSISRHIENIHLSGKTPVYKCDECPFACKSPLKLVAHKQCHGTVSSEWDPMSSLNESMSSTFNESYESNNINGRKSGNISDSSPQNPYKCTICNYSTTTLKGLRVHQQHKHSFCDNLPNSGNLVPQMQGEEIDLNEPSTVRKSQTSILGLSSKNNFVAKGTKKGSSEFPLDLSPVKKRTRIDEIASNLQSKINQSKQQEDAVINVEDDEDDEENEVEIEVELDKEEEPSEQDAGDQYPMQHMWNRDIATAQKNTNYRNIQSNYSSSNGAEIELTLSDDDEEYCYQSSAIGDQDHNSSLACSQANLYESDQIGENAEFNEESGRLYYCKHCDFSNKSARSVSTHYQRMHPYIKFSFRYILDPNDHSAVYRCLECYIDFNNFEDLQHHYSEHHPEAMNVLNFNQSDLIYRCRFCSYTSPNVRSLMPHYQRMHPTVKINNAMIFSSYIVDRSEELSSESQTLREILNSAPKNMLTSTPSSHGNSSTVSFNKTSTSNAKSYTTDNDNQKSSPVNNVVVYDCDICGFASPNMHSVLVHSQKKHPEEKASYYRIQKTMRVVPVDSGTAISQLAFDGGASVSPSMSSVVQQPEINVELYYCKHCSYSNRSVVGVLVHYQKRHPEIKVTAKYIRQALPTSESLRNADGHQNISRKLSGPVHSTKKGIGQPKENEMFFCQHCDYGNQTVKGVLIHYQKKHKDYKVNADAVRQHTAAIRSLCEQGQKKATIIQNPPSLAEPDKAKLRSLKCRQCSFSTPYVYALRKHMKKDHPNLKATVTSILKWAFLDGFIEAGYHCEWCIYFHSDPSGLLEHYQRRHPEHYVDYTYMATKLCAGPEASPLQITPETKSYKCRDCNFEAPSIWDITNHYQSFHPWALKGDESVLLNIIKDKDAIQNPHSEENTFSHIPSTPKGLKNMVPLMECGDDSRLLQRKPSHLSSSLLSSPYQCTVCHSEYNNLHGLLTHYGKKHPGMKVKAADFAQDVDLNRGAVYKCRHCPYINTRIHGVLTHYQKRHPLIKVTAEDFVHDVEQCNESSQNESEENRIFKQGYGAYSCKLCPYTHGSLEKLKIHYEKYHHQAELEILAKSSENEISPTKTIVHSDYNLPQTIVTLEPGEVTEITGFRPRKNINPHAVFRCQLCKYYCSTRKGIARHYRIKHNNVRAQPEGQNNLFKCALCSYTNPIRKGLAAHYQKRHDIDAYYTHCLAASKSGDEEPCKVMIPTPLKEEHSEMTDDLKMAIESKTCSLCSFQSFSKKGIVSHYIKRHPGVFPKKQHVSKLGAYFTLVYGDKIESEIPPNFLEEKPEIDAPSEDSETQEPELLPFRCIKCFKLSFSTADLLCMHYTDHHSKDIKRDFSILGTTGTRSYTTTYQCKHCNTKLTSISELTSHLSSHIEEFQKRAKRQERRKQLLQKQKSTENAVQDCKQEKTGNGQETVKNALKEKVVVGYKCKFCVEVHPTLRAIVNHLRKHIGHGNAPPLPPEVKEDTDVSNMDACKVETEKELAESTDPKPAVEDDLSTVVKKEAKLPKRCRVGGYPCKQCDRVLMSMQGLRSHERSHLALAMFTREDKYSCQFCSFVSAFRHNLDRHLQEHHGHHKPFRCKHCPFKSSSSSRLKTHFAKAHGGEHAYKCSFCSISKMTISQLKDHCIKAHGKSLTLPKLRTMTPSSPRSKHDLGPQIGKEGPEEPIYAEPPDVQQQLNHYQSAALARNNSNNSPVPLPVAKIPSEPKEDSILKCEFCDFSSGYIQSIRRHYRDKHGGKKLFKCKECSFYTCFKSAFTMHVEAGHSSVPQEGPKDLRCPLCLYHTKFKHNMIDHIVLHREERVVPIEICRSKLSKQLQGVVFRCDKCTFTCSSDESLQQHIVKHNELRPYKCQLCYYETKQNEELDGHLREEHKVCRNFELVGLVNLDQLEQMKDQTEPSSSDEEETAVKSEVKTQVPDVKDVAQEKRFPCEFCGRSFTLQTEWEKHVLRHGMTLGGNRKENEENKTPEENIENTHNDIKLEEEIVDTAQQTKTSCLKILTVTKNE